MLGSMKNPRLRHSSMGAAAALFFLLAVLQGCAYLSREGNIAYMKVNALFSARDIEIEINAPFLEMYKNKVTITATFTVDKAMQNPIGRSLDGDLHFAGRAPEIALPLVGEIANAASEKPAIDLVHSVEGTGRPLKVSGAWRIWPEHPGSAPEDQGMPLAPMDSKSPDHVFEIHPITRINNLEILDTFRPVEGFLPGNAHSTFEIFQGTECRLTAEPGKVKIVTRKGLYNDVEFLLEVADSRQIEVPDGRFVFASAMDLDGNLLVKQLRMVFVRDTPPEKAVKLLKKGARLHVFGLPRLDFEEISRRVKGSQKDPELLLKSLPYEIMIIGVYKDAK